MNKCFIDINVVLDTILPGRPLSNASETVLKMGSEECRLYLSSMSVATLYYVVRKNVGREEARTIVSEWFKKNYVLPVSDICVYDALRSDCPDFEDAMQIACADYGDCDCIITNNVKDFRGYAPLPVFSPEEFIAGCHEAVVRRHEYYEYLESLPDACFIDEGPGEKNLGN